jgi:hypothetical protein
MEKWPTTSSPKSVALRLFLFLLGWSTSPCVGAGLTPAQLGQFENKIRPIFAEHCYQCHSPARGKVKGGLELDWKGGWEKGGDSGPALVPGDPEKSLLIKAVRYTDPDLQMPPKGQRLSPAEIGALVDWIKAGAPDPRTSRPSADTPSAPTGKAHWAYQPIKAPAIPHPPHESWAHNDVDRFILAKIEANGLEPNPPADKRTLIRRVYYDLIGLPPSEEQVNSFLKDDSPAAFEKVVGELLDSPRYGERWGRHWLDVARYSDAKGQPDRRRESAIYPYAWTYRDYVISAFNQDKPYDRFIVEQLAADKLSLGTNRTALAALGFLTLGDHFNGNTNDIINDRIDVTTKAFLGLTVSCARCHDHKFDPIPQADYYSLHGIFASSTEPLSKPEITEPASNPGYQEYLVQRADIDSRLLNMRTQNLATVFGDYKRLTGVYLFATQMPEKDRAAYLVKMGAQTNLVKSWQQITRGGGRQVASIFGLWNALTRIPEARFAIQAPRMLANLDRNERARELNPFVVQAFKTSPPRTLGEAAALYGTLFASTDPAWQTYLTAVLGDAVLRLLPNPKRAQYFALREQSDLLEMVHPGAPARAPVLVDSATPKDSPVFIRGEAENKGDIVPRRFLEALSGPSRPAFKNGSGRLELAQAIANKNNPLTARVMVNRVWQHHFGEGFVATPDDLGCQSAPPSHPELLDYLSSRFMADGWSIKKLHKLILLSATYQESSAPNPAAAEKDPFNRLLARANVRRLEFEPLRDSLLSYSGQLDLAVGGHPVDLSQGIHPPKRGMGRIAGKIPEFRLAGGSRRTVYGYMDRADPMEELNTFDVASPSAPTGKRYETIVPQQALFLMNSPLVVEQVRHIVQRPEFKAQTCDDDRIRYLYTLFFQRSPTDEELRAAKDFMRAERQNPSDRIPPAPADGEAKPPRKPRAPLTGWDDYAQVLLMTNEAAFVD